jgi:hypothetical protein
VFFYKVQYILGVVMAWKTHIIWKISNMQKYESHKKWKAKTQPNHQDNPLHMCLWVCLSTSWWHFCHDSCLVTYIYIYILYTFQLWKVRPTITSQLSHQYAKMIGWNIIEHPHDRLPLIWFPSIVMQHLEQKSIRTLPFVHQSLFEFFTS